MSGYAPVAGSSRERQHDQSQHERVLSDIKRQLALHDTYDEEEEEIEDIDEDDRFVNLSLYSHVAMRLRDKVPRGTHVKGGIPYARAFTGRDIVVSVRTFKYTMEYQSGMFNNFSLVHHSSTNTKRTRSEHAHDTQ
jgi:hypothetical protein